MQIKGLSHSYFMQPSAQTSNFKRRGIPQPLWAPAPAFACSPGKIFFILAGLNFQCWKFFLLPIILPLLKRLLFPSSLQPPVSSSRHQVSPQAFSFQMKNHFILTLFPCIMCLSDSVQVFSAFLVLGSPKFGTVVHKGCTQGNTSFPPPASALLLALTQPWVQLGCFGVLST